MPTTSAPASGPDAPDSGRVGQAGQVGQPGLARQQLTAQRMLALFVLALLLFNFPLLALWDHAVLLWGLPLLPVALFAVWALLIVALALVLERRAG